MKKAIILLSGGIDSTTLAADAISQGYELSAISFNYGQRSSLEVENAKKVASSLGIKDHRIANIDLNLFGNSALTDNRIAIPKNNDWAESKDIPATYVPARNTIFLSFALALAEVKQANDIFIGVHAIDYSNYPDCRPEYIESFEKMANLAIKETVTGKMKIKIQTPFINISKTEIIKKGLELGVDYSLTSSCYDLSSEGHSCGKCDACQIRIHGFRENNAIDPIAYKEEIIWY
jgi:7-cyano-7-deazaguanine synthase